MISKEWVLVTLLLELKNRMLVTKFLMLLFKVSKAFGSKNSYHLLEEKEQAEYLKILRKGNASSYVFFQRNRLVEEI